MIIGDLGQVARYSRAVIDRVKPEIDGGRFAAKRYIDEPIEVQATLLIDGHDLVKGRLLYRHEEDRDHSIVPMRTKGNDEWRGSFQPDRLGRYLVTIEAAVDRFGTWRSDLKKKFAAGQDIKVDLQVGEQLLSSWEGKTDEASWDLVQDKINRIRALVVTESQIDIGALTALVEDPAFCALAESIYDDGSVVRYHQEVPIQVEPTLARFSSWYEFFPRSTGKNGKHGDFRTAAAHLEYVRSMGFDVVYLPPIHPIGEAFRKGKNNTLTPVPGDVGSPWAIGGKKGGHKALHPDLGSFEDFEYFVDAAKGMGIEIAMDIAFQCSPDHPYVKEHPEWFKKRPDGTIQYAENPPKKYQDIYPFDFECADWRNLWNELRDVVQFWVDRGVTIFRVDNPHTKPFHFWEWLIRDIRAKRPEVIFLSEAFTRPHVMGYLAKSGFSQSYTYFTWRNTKHELTQYMTELTKTELVDYFMPNFWPNTPDILPEALQVDQRSIYMQRLILAATLSSSYGMYGPAFELMDWRPVTPGKEEYLDSEKYQLRDWSLDDPKSLAPLITRVNEIRRSQPALQNNRSLRFHPVSNDSLLAYSKSFTAPDGKVQRVLVVVNLDPHHTHSGLVELPLFDWGFDPEETFQVHDLMSDARYYWSGWRNFVELNPHSLPAHVFVVRQHVRSASDFEYFL